MSDTTSLRAQAAAWFNQTWTLLEKKDRTDSQTLDMLALAQASFAAWMAVPEHTSTHESIGAWQVSRAHALAGEGKLAEAWGRRALSAASETDPFYRAYALEALARALRVQGRRSEVPPLIARAREALAGTAEDELETLHSDLQELEDRPGSGAYYSISVHSPKPEYRQKLTDSMHRYGEACRTQPGLIEVRTLASLDGEAFVGYAVWESAGAKEAANPVLRKAVEGDDFALWEHRDIEGWGLESV